MPCPADFGVVYRLTFLAGSRTILRASVHGAGCQFARISDGRLLWATGARGAAFWATLGRALHLSPDELRGIPLPGGPAGSPAGGSATYSARSNTTIGLPGPL